MHVLQAVVAPDLPPAARAGQPVAQPEHVPRDRAPRRPMRRRLAHHIRGHLLFHRFPGSGPSFRLVEELRIPLLNPPGVVVRLAADHDAVYQLKLLSDMRAGGNTAVGGNREMRKVALEPMHDLIAQRRDLAVLLRRQTLEPGITRMNQEYLATRLAHGADEVAHEVIALALVDADAVFDRDGDPGGIDHRPDAFSHQVRLRHQARAERAALHALAGTAAVEVDFVITP